ncbi:hypothetical protein KUTeg_019994 [Tegillarca granosa]|uniref:Nucleoside diphosphate-linked moiety X motif 19 n=1 Tax=Tegillarca granosa TaxID=220873 RepID=A0ABQ9EK27_TEGGR|nr:hypothetical protein KUTeg_019994 [Tegillarca granosa]
MAAILKHWREAATLILVSKIKQNAPRICGNGGKTNHDPPKPLYNYKILMLKRSMKSKFMPSLYVFPGGTAENADFSSEWLDIFRVTKDCNESLQAFVKRGGVGPPMFSRQRDPEFQSVPSELAFRICAIRETFEESGVLLVRHKDYFKRHNVGVTVKEQPVTAHVYQLSESEIATWRNKVDKDPGEFITLCKTFDVVPDIWSLSEWSNWLTPVIMGDSPPDTRSGRRYDTAFYLCMLDEAPPALHDEKETVHSQWSTPDTLIREYFKSGGLAPPQVYEVCRLLNFKDAEDLNNFAWKRAEQRVVRYFPVIYFCQDGVSIVYPGNFKKSYTVLDPLF